MCFFLAEPGYLSPDGRRSGSKPRIRFGQQLLALPVKDLLRQPDGYRRVDRDHLELTMTLTDPKTYARPWNSQKKVFTLQPPGSKTVSNDGWYGLFEEICAPVDEIDQFNASIRNRAVDSPEK